MANFIYGVLTNTGKGFFTAEDRRNFFLRSYVGYDGSNYVDVWVIGANEKGAGWLADKNGVEKTKAEAQALVNAATTQGQTEYDALTEEQQELQGPRPTAVTIP